MSTRPKWAEKGPRVSGTLPGRKGKEIVALDRLTMSPSYAHVVPIVGEEGKNVYVRDVDGNVFLDISSGMFVLNYGYSHPKLVKAVQKQSAKLAHFAGTDFYYKAQIDLADKLIALTPGDVDKRVYFGNSGTEAVEAAFKCARWHTRRPRIISYLGAFHGRTFGAMSLSSSSVKHHRYFFPLVPGVSFMPYPYCYRCPFNKEYPGCDFECVDYIRTSLKTVIPAEEVAAVIAEPIQGNSGYVIPPKEYWPKVKEICDENDWLFIADEIQTGLGRTGKVFAMEHWGVTPDIVCVAKALSGGMAPIGAMIGRLLVMNWEPGTHASTFGGNLVACAAALAGLEVMEKEKLVEKADRLGKYALKRLREMKDKHPLIGDVRGKGMMMAVELVKNRETKKPAIKERNALLQVAASKGLIVFPGGTSTIRIAPSLTIEKEDLDLALSIFDKTLKEVEKK